MNRIYYIIFSLIVISNSSAQLSPGDLSQAHADLEGLSNCTRCHEIGKKVQPQNCLSCHKILNERIIEGKGLHANAGYEDCTDCHSEHHGREYKLIYWDEGQENFDHKETGFELSGKHAGLKCSDCHSPKNIKDKQTLQSQKKDLNRTFLGLSKVCLNCHQDEHRSQMDNNCLSCHDMNGWIPAPKFDHDNTKFKLTGLHEKVPCKNCHKTITDNKFEQDKSYLKFAGLQFNNCTNCHSDPHSNRFGETCENCHNTSGWQNYARNRFDHNKTNYPLEGKHSLVSCESCHAKNKSKKIIRFTQCTDCHQDYHAGQFKERSQKGNCEECHSVSGFSPANFTISDHQKTKFQLTGSHLAIPCIACHEAKGRNNQGSLQFDFTNINCESCHIDPHNGQVDQYKRMNNNTGCIYCHKTESWQMVNFDHSQTNFLLEGKHKLIRCNDCHISENKSNINLGKLTMECASCHEDIHNRQFNNMNNKTDCGKCHTPIDWFAEKFDHEVHSQFKLEGAHSNVTCEKCHIHETLSGKLFVRYKPLKTECKSCHLDINRSLKRK